MTPLAKKENQVTDLQKDIEFAEGEEQFKPEDLPLRKRMFYAAMVRSFGNVSVACTVSGIKRGTYKKWMATDDDFRTLMNDGDFEERALDFAESKLMHKIEQGDIIGTIFFLKTKGKKRGYIEGNAPAQLPSGDNKPTWFDPPKLPAASHENNIEEATVISETKNADNGI